MKSKDKQLILNRDQIRKLSEIADHFGEIEWFKVEESNISGIGPTITVSFNLFNKNDTKIDITDVSTW
jgi:hypothetical protein